MSIRTKLPTFALGTALVFGQGTAWSATPGSANIVVPHATSMNRQPTPARQASQAEQNRQVVIERYEDGKPRIHREIALDKTENFVSHGQYTVYAPNGRVVGGGQYHLGYKTGEWTRIHDTIVPVISEHTAPGFGGPFTSTATFLNDQLNGDWSITDGKQRPVVMWQFSHGKRHGQWLWFNSDGTTRKQIQFDNDKIASNIVAGDGNAELKVLVPYVHGRELATHIAHFSQQQRKSQGYLLKPREESRVEVNWWEGKMETQVVARHGELDRHGEWTFFHPNGKIRMQGTYDQGKETGRFVWHYENGQKSSEGYYNNGKRQGRWEMWYASGGRKTAGQCVDDVHEGNWMSWHENGMPKLQAQYEQGSIVQAKSWNDQGRRVENIATRGNGHTRLSSKPATIPNEPPGFVPAMRQ